MQITKILIKTKCDFTGCKNLANISLFDENDLNKKLNLCDSCLTKIYECVAKTIVPKSLETPFKKQKKLR